MATARGLIARDPSRTMTLRKRMMQDMTRRILRIKRAIVDAVVTKDCFALRSEFNVVNFSNVNLEERSQFFMHNVMRFGISTLHTNLEARAYEFHSDVGKIEAFQGYLQEQVDAEILTVDGRGNPWTNEYVNSAYRQGVVRAYTDSKSEALAEKADFYDGSKSQFLQDSFAAPETRRKLELLHTRTFEDLKGFSAAMSQQTSRVLTSGLGNGWSAAQISKALVEQVDGLDKKRAQVIARTEIIHAHAEGQLDAFEKLGVEEVGTMAEWQTAGDDRVCSQCADLNSQVMTVEEARGQIPLHPNCRCAWLPVLASAEAKTSSKKSKKSVKESAPVKVPKESKPKPKPKPKPKVVPVFDPMDPAVVAVGDAPKIKDGLPYSKQPGEKLPKLKPVRTPLELSQRANDLGVKVAYVEDMGASGAARHKKITKLLSDSMDDALNRPMIQELRKDLGSDLLDGLKVESNQFLEFEGKRATGLYHPSINAIELGYTTVSKTHQTLPGMWTVDASFAGTVRHEIGHSIHQAIAKAGLTNPKYSGLEKAWDATWMKFPNKKLQNQLSHYAATSPSEAFAEAFSMYTHPAYVKGQLPKEFEEFMDKFVGEKVAVAVKNKKEN